MINPEFLAKVATDALLQEVNLAPKPGLVDPISVGAHKDMTKETFYQSIELFLGPSEGIGILVVLILIDAIIW